MFKVYYLWLVIRNKASKLYQKGSVMFPSGMEWIIVALLILLLFGAKKIPELARGIGQGIGEFKKASSEIRREIEKGEREDQQEANVNRPKQESEKKEATNN